MMKLYAQLNEYGVPISTSTNQYPNMIPLPENADPQKVVLQNDAWYNRPEISVQIVDNMVTLQNIPPGTRVEVVDVDTLTMILDVIIDGDEEILLQDSGQYQIEVQPPMPYISWNGRVSC